MNLKNFANFQPFNELRSEMGASQLGDFDVSRPLSTEKKQDSSENQQAVAQQPSKSKPRTRRKTAARKPAKKKEDTASNAKSTRNDILNERPAA